MQAYWARQIYVSSVEAEARGICEPTTTRSRDSNVLRAFLNINAKWEIRIQTRRKECHHGS
jgi:hypothetical protein